MFFTRDKVERSERILTTERDGSYTNSQARVDAANYLDTWAKHLDDFAGKSDTQVSEIVGAESQRLYKVLEAADVEKDWERLRCRNAPGYRIVNVWLLNGAFMLGGRFFNLDTVLTRLGVHMQLSDSSRDLVQRLWDEESTCGIPDYSDQLKVSIRKDW